MLEKRRHALVLEACSFAGKGLSHPGVESVQRKQPPDCVTRRQTGPGEHCRKDRMRYQYRDDVE